MSNVPRSAGGGGWRNNPCAPSTGQTSSPTSSPPSLLNLTRPAAGPRRPLCVHRPHGIRNPPPVSGGSTGRRAVTLEQNNCSPPSTTAICWSRVVTFVRRRRTDDSIRSRSPDAVQHRPQNYCLLRGCAFRGSAMLLRVSALFAMLYWPNSLLSGGVHLPPPSGGAVVQLLRRPQESKQIDFGEQYPDRAGDEQQEQQQEQQEVPPSRPITRGEPAWLHSGKFQGDIDGVDEQLLRQLKDPAVQFNALRNRQLIWPSGVIPYELDLAFSLSEARLLQRAFRAYRRRTMGCIRFRPRRGAEPDYLNIVKGNGCYSQVGKTGGKQELSLGRGCLFNETITHELMHSLGFWHEHSRADRDDHIIIRWQNILPGMDSQFDIVSSAIQDTLGEPYDYRSIMHYGSSAFSRNGRNTLEAVVDEFTNVIGTAMELSELDVVKIMKLYRCRRRDPPAAWRGSYSPWRRRKPRPLMNQSPPDSSSSSSTSAPPSLIDAPSSGEAAEGNAEYESAGEQPGQQGPWSAEEVAEGTAPPPPVVRRKGRRHGTRCRDHFLDCPQFRDYCKRISFYFIMRSYCPMTCGRCRNTTASAAAPARELEDEDEREEEEEMGKWKRR